MNIETKFLPQVSQEVINYLAKSEYSDQTLEHYKTTYNQLYLYLTTKEVRIFSCELALQFIDRHYSIARKAQGCYYANLKRRIRVLFEFSELGAINTRRYVSQKRELTILQPAMNHYVKEQEHFDLATKTVEHKVALIKDFLLYLETMQFHSLEKLSAKDIYAYLGTKRNHAISTREGIMYRLREALKIFAASEMCAPELTKLFLQISTHSERTIPSCFTSSELKSIFSSIDRSSSIGKRDYAVLLLATFLGLRAGDIREFKISSIKWASESIELTQSKTKRFLQLPLLPELKYALLDYLKNSRPKSESDFLFIKHNAPHHPYGKYNSFYHILQKYLGKIELNGRRRGLHSLRFSAAGNLLSNGTPITTICSILGHSYADTTNHYLKIDFDSLRKAALEVDYD